MGSYLSGAMSRNKANSKLWFYITDPASFYELWFEQCGWDSPITERRDNIAEKIIIMLRGLKSMIADSDDLRRRITAELNATGDDSLSPEASSRLVKLRTDVKTFRAEISSPKQLCDDVPIWKSLFGDESALLAAETFYAFEREKRPIKESDGIDFVHAIYLPHTDLWRGDKAFSDLLIKHKVRFSDRIVPTLLELPARIEMEWRKQNAAP